MADGIDMRRTASLSNTTLMDILKNTQDVEPYDGSFETLQNLHDYEICNRWMAKDKITFDGGTSIVRHVQVTESGAAQWVVPYQTTEPSVTDVQARIRANWCYIQTDYSIAREEMLVNRSRPKLIDLMKSRRLAAMMDLAELLELWVWRSPTNSSDALHPFGVPMYITPIITAQTYGHVGCNPLYNDTSAVADCAGIDSSLSAYSRWRNYADRWNLADSFEGVIEDEDIIKITRMLRRLHFKSPTFVTDIDNGSYKNLRLYTGEEVIESLEERARKQNDQLGSDVARYAGATIIKNLPVIWIERLDYANSSTYPFYALNHTYFKPFVMEGNWLRENEPIRSKGQHNVFTTFVDAQMNIICTNRQRAGGIISAVVA